MTLPDVAGHRRLVRRVVRNILCIPIFSQTVCVTECMEFERCGHSQSGEACCIMGNVGSMVFEALPTLCTKSQDPPPSPLAAKILTIFQNLPPL